MNKNLLKMIQVLGLEIRSGFLTEDDVKSIFYKNGYVDSDLDELMKSPNWCSMFQLKIAGCSLVKFGDIEKDGIVLCKGCSFKKKTKVDFIAQHDVLT